MFEKVSRSLKYDSNFFFDYRHIYGHQVDHFTPLVLRVRGKKKIKPINIFYRNEVQYRDDVPTKRKVGL